MRWRGRVGVMLLGLAMSVSACGGGSAKGGAPVDAGGPPDVAADQGAPAPLADADVGPDGAPCRDPHWPDYHVCCGRVGEVTGSNCVPAALLAQPCAGEGEFADIKRFIRCCDGLSAMSTARVIAEPSDDAGVCDLPFELDPTRVCTHCGDGTCGLGENTCNCPQDCP